MVHKTLRAWNLAAWTAPPDPPQDPRGCGVADAGLALFVAGWDCSSTSLERGGARSCQRRAGTDPHCRELRLTGAGETALPGDPRGSSGVRRRRPGSIGSWNLEAGAAALGGQDTGAGAARAWRGGGAGCRHFFWLGAARAWRGHVPFPLGSQDKPVPRPCHARATPSQKKIL
eukprot:gene15429-biopygen655